MVVDAARKTLDIEAGPLLQALNMIPLDEQTALMEANY
jgi:hypothetical protein